MNKHIGMKIGASAGLLLWLAGCAPTTPQWDSNFGNSVRASVAAQVADPAAVNNTRSVNGIDGTAARATQKAYERSFLTPATASPSIIGGAIK